VRKGKSIIGKDILSLEDGLRLDKVNDLVVDPEGRSVVALLVSEGGFMSSSMVVPTEEVSSYGKDAVVVRSRGSVISAGEDPELRTMVERQEKILGKKVFTTAGDAQGSISDIYFDDATAAVVGYEVSGGLLGDATKGTSYLATDEITTIGNDVIYVHPETAQALDAQVGGIQGALQGAGDKIAEATDAAGKKLEQSRDAAAQQKPSGPGKADAALIGKRTGSDVETDTGSVIVPKGRRIRAEDVAAAREAGKLPALSASVAKRAAEDASAGAKDALGAAGDKAGSLWDQFTAKLGEMTDANGRRVDQEQTKKRLAEISDAIGRPVTKVILDRDDNVVLNMGDIVTHQAIQRAHEAGGLDSLLGSVYRGEVQFTKEEMRAPTEVEAQATVEKARGGAALVDELETRVEQAAKESEAEKERKRREAEAQREERERERQARESEREAEKEARESDSTDESPVAVGPGPSTETSRPRITARSR
jgi:uncharacterized protein YrrD